jgi:predicted AlkP superfamily pyrophosphatase or phosphodiesterase
MRFLFFVLAVMLSNASFSDDNIVILLSWDGMRHDFPDRGNYPALKRIEREGIRAGRLTPVYLSNTFPGHVSLATGAEPQVHGIVDNVFFDREKGLYAYNGNADWINAEPLWMAAERQGVKAATYFWVGSESDWRGQGTSYRMAPFDGSRPEADKVDKMIEWLDLSEDMRPRLIMSYWRGADTVAHVKGPDHADVAAEIADQDQELARLLGAIDQRNLWPRTTLIIVSDHGMTRVTESVEIKTALEEAGLDVRVTGGSAAQHLFLKQASDRQAVLNILARQPHIKVYESDAIPAPLAAPNRTGDIVITTTPPYTFDRADSLLDKAIVFVSPLFGWEKGSHGYDPSLADMGGIFFAMGNGVTKGKRIDDIHQLEVAPTVTRLLGIQAPSSASRNGISLD